MSTSTAVVLLGRYRVESVLKDGHAVRTVLAEDLTSGTPVVVKTAALARLLPAVRLRLEHEAAVLGSLESDWVAPVLDFGRDGELACLVSPLLPGTSLQQHLVAGRLPLHDALGVVR
ncbi:MAG TPA: hypothetical protein VNC22_05370, partial [Sporichthya sp.]|nr:hypothetical protein [Sporichthya sp.]